MQSVGRNLIKSSDFKSKAFSKPRETFTTVASKNDFVPFEQQRDHLGRLITGNKQQSKSNWVGKSKNADKLGIESKISVEPASSTIEKMFRYTQLSERSAGKDKKKMRILSTASIPFPTPSVGYYDSATITDRMKYRKARQVSFGSPKKPSHIEPPNPKSSRSSKVVVYQQVQTQPSRKNGSSEHAPSLNFNLPELEKYRQMRKLKLSFYQNFEESHSKFKELVENTLSLAKKIKVNLDRV